MASGLAIAALIVGAADVAKAGGTLAGTTISNTASVAYSVGGTAQPAITGTVDFVVDRKIDLTLTPVPGALVTVTPGTTGNLIPFILTNTGNAPLDFSLAAANRANGTADPYGGATPDNFDSVNQVFADNNNNTTYDAGVDTSSVATNLGIDASRRVFVVASIPGGQAGGSISVVTVTATATELGGAALTNDAGADVAATMQTVFADAAGDTDALHDAAFSDSSGFLVVGATVTVTKIETVVSDPVNGVTNPKHIPGALVQYQVTVHNDATATANADTITLTDVMPGNVTFQPNTYAAGSGIQVDGVAKTNVTADDNADFTANTVTVTIPTLAPNTSSVITFRVTVN